MSIFISNLAKKLEEFILFKNSLGIEYKTCRVHLRHLDAYNYEHGNFNTLTKEITEAFIIYRADKSTSRDRSYIPPIREFGRYLRSMGDTEAYVLDSRFAIQHYHAEVYLLANDEIQTFFKECDTYVLKNPNVWISLVIQTFIKSKPFIRTVDFTTIHN